jgi:hypothetical protein
MLVRVSRFGWLLGLSVSAASIVGACGGKKDLGNQFSTGTGGTGANQGPGAGGAGHSGSTGTIILTTSSGAGASQAFDVQPAIQQTLLVTAGQNTPVVAYTATLNGQPAPGTAWGLDQGAIGSIPAGPGAMEKFTPSGSVGGLVTITASLNKMTLTRTVLVKLTATQNGADPNNPAQKAQIPAGVGDLTAGGGVGGVGGEGLGTPVSDPATVMALGAPTNNGQSQGLTFLYPYDKTVWPRGLPAPLLMWSWAPGDADAIKIDIKSKSGSFSYSGTFGRPAILMQTKGPFIRHPIPQNVWDMATNSANGTADPLTVSLTVAKGGMAYGPISETWTIAPSHLSGTIYYNSYGTNLVQNSGGAVGGTGMFGAAVLGIKVGAIAPKVVAGTNTDCRTCHSVAAFGSRLEAQPYGTYSAYDLTPMGAVEHVMPNTGAWFPGLYPDGSKMLTADGLLLSLPAGGTLPVSGLPTDPETPMFSPDGKFIAFNSAVGPKITVMSFANATGAFTAPVTVVDDTNNAGFTPAWPAFFPDSKSLVFHHQSDPGIDGAGTDPCTRGGALAQVDWASVASPGNVVHLDNLNGKGYLPKLPAPVSLACDADGNAVGGMDADHSNDVNHNYEPTANPIASGGYAWVVFTSRRMYGNEATIPPFCSDPRGVDLVQNITTKKLWVSAIDLNQAPGADSSHPAFYLPAQELLAGNSRGFWVLDPCLADGTSCMTGDQCCNGYCEPSGPMGQLVCSNAPPMGTCSGVGDKCTTAADCCDTTNQCINGFCTVGAPQ